MAPAIGQELRPSRITNEQNGPDVRRIGAEIQGCLQQDVVDLSKVIDELEEVLQPILKPVPELSAHNENGASPLPPCSTLMSETCRLRGEITNLRYRLGHLIGRIEL